jgi:hypothetical protein
MIHHVQLGCPPGSEPALREFYGGVLGLDEIPCARVMGPGSVVAAGGPAGEGLRIWAWPRSLRGGWPMVSW